MQEQKENVIEVLFIETCKHSLHQSFNGRNGIVNQTKQINIPLAIMDTMAFFEIFYTYYIRPSKT
jgi:hypothetical protein